MKKLAEVITYRAKDGGGTEDQRTKVFYDGLGRPQTTIFPDGSREISLYKFNQLDSFETRRGQKKVIDTYDARGRENHHYWLAVDGITVDSSTPAVTRDWDDANRLRSIANVFSTIAYSYDDAGQVHTETTTVAGSGPKQMSYSRYPSGEVSHLFYPGGTAIYRHYTTRGQLGGVGWGSGSTSYAYLADGKVDYQSWQGGEWTKFLYDGRGILGSVRHQKTAGGPDLAYREYHRDDRDRILAWKRGIDRSCNGMEDGRGDRYRYDPEGQLDMASYRAELDSEWVATQATRSDIFTYDELGNRKGSNNYLASLGWQDFRSKDNGLNQYRKWWPHSLIWYDDDLGGWGHQGAANGVLMQDGWITAGFNALNQPICMWSPVYPGDPGAQWVWFGYDPLGRCVKRWMGPVVDGHAPPANSNPVTATYFYYDGWNLVQEGPSGATPNQVYVHGGRVDEIVASAAGGPWRHHHYDGQGNCIFLTDGWGAILEQYDYDAFGRPYFYNAGGDSVGTSLYNNRFLFTGREWLKDLKVYDYRNRMYQPELGRFLQPDPKQFAAGDYNLYRYCHNDPVNRSDPFGLEGWTDYTQVVGLLFRENYNSDATHSSPQQAAQALIVAVGNTALDVARTGLIDLQAREVGEMTKSVVDRIGDKTGTLPAGGKAENAVRHTLGSALLTRAFGSDVAKKMGDIHENNAQDKKDSAVDQNNNAIGRQIGAGANFGDDLKRKVLDEFVKKKLDTR
jgi:RHS repeat-associated protein